MIDELAIRTHAEWDGKKYRGFIDLGTGVDDNDSLPLAKDARVFMVVAVNSTWKVPCAYFLVNGLNGIERANLIKMCLRKLLEVGVKVISLTCDGPSCHFSMLSELGLNLNPYNLKTNFPHPHNSGANVYALLDVCHMLKLVRNTLSDGGILQDKDGNKIYLHYLVELYKLQTTEGLRLANKLKKAHIECRQQKMKVNLAAQAISSSVADAIEYCSDKLKLPQFEGSAATINFIRTFDRLFDILNSRNPLANGFKSALRTSNRTAWQPFLKQASEYILGLSDTGGIKMVFSRRKTGFIGFLIAIKSIEDIFCEWVEPENSPLRYLLTYKLSQDHLELFFGAIRCCGGFNNNPTSRQFTAAYKRLLLRSSIQSGHGNCITRDSTSILHILEDTCYING